MQILRFVPDPQAGGNEKPYILSYLGMRQLAGWVGFALPFAVALGNVPHALEGSISAYYFTRTTTHNIDFGGFSIGITAPTDVINSSWGESPDTPPAPGVMVMPLELISCSDPSTIGASSVMLLDNARLSHWDAEKTFDEWLVILADIEGQWAIVQNSWEVANDPALRANGMIASFDDADGIRRELITNPVQFDETPATLSRGPLFAEHTDEVLRELGLTDERLVELKIAGAIT